MAKFIWQDGTLVSKAKVEIGGTIYEVDPEEYSGTTPLSASNLNAMQDGIYEDMEEADNEIAKIGDYSTSEIVVGTWEGKPLYRKIITGNLGSSSVSHGISNAVFKIPRGHYTSGSNIFPIPNVRPNYSDYNIGCYVTPTEIVFDKGNGLGQGNTFEIVLEYIKTTD